MRFEFLWKFGGGVSIITITMVGGNYSSPLIPYIEIAVTKHTSIMQ